MEIFREGVRVAIPEKRVQEVLGEVARFVRTGRVTRKGGRSRLGAGQAQLRGRACPHAPAPPP
eukprot:5708921-Alexandrium_andersonii.AAC.1